MNFFIMKQIYKKVQEVQPIRENPVAMPVQAPALFLHFLYFLHFLKKR